MYKYLVSVACCVGWCCSIINANFWCPGLIYQEKESEAIKSLRRF